jgi:hypothetical protein
MRRERTYVRQPSVRTDTTATDPDGTDRCSETFGFRSDSLDQS